MAVVSTTTRILGGNRLWKLESGGPMLMEVEVVVSATGDLTAGLDLAPIVGRFGMRRIFAVLMCSMRDSTGTYRKFPFTFEPGTAASPTLAKVHILALNGGLDEMRDIQAADITNLNWTLTLVLLGV